VVQSWWIGADLQVAVSAFLLLVALVRGAAPELILAAVLFAARLAQVIYETQFEHPAAATRLDGGYLLIDLALVAGIAAVALAANRVYPLWIGAAQIAAMTPHLVRAVLPKAAPAVSRIIDGAAFDIQLVALALGLCFHIARRQRLARPYTSWHSRSNG
jgi:hypothetical protein